MTTKKKNAVESEKMAAETKAAIAPKVVKKTPAHTENTVQKTAVAAVGFASRRVWPD